MRLASVVFLLGACAAASKAQVGELSVSLGESIFKNNKLGAASAADLLSQFKVGNGFRIGARLTLNTKRFIGHEFGGSYSHSHLALTNSSDEASIPTYQGFYDFLVSGTPKVSRIRP